MSIRSFPVACALALFSAGCGDEPRPVPGVPAAAESGAQPADAAPLRTYERSVVFVSTAADSVLMVPWVVEATTVPGGVDRTARGWLGRNGAWEPFLRASWTTPPNREPWRVLPQGPFRILVGEGDRLDRVFYEGGSRRLEVVLDDPVTQWTGNRGGSFLVVEGGLVLGDRRVPGRVLDVTQGIRVAEGSMGDWLYLVSGDSVVVVIQAPLYQEEGMAYQGWARDGDQELQWPEVRVSWEESRAFEPARRDVPGILALRTPGGGLSGQIQVTAMQLETRDGPGPLLPVDGVMEIQGTVRIQGRSIPVRGVLRHRQR